MLEVEDIKKIDKINIDPNVPDRGSSAKRNKPNILDALNEDGLLDAGQLAPQDKKFFA